MVDPRLPDAIEDLASTVRSVRMLELMQWRGKSGVADGMEHPSPVAEWLCFPSPLESGDPLGTLAGRLVAAELMEPNLDVHRLIRAFRVHCGLQSMIGAGNQAIRVPRGEQPYQGDDSSSVPPRAIPSLISLTAYDETAVIPGVPRASIHLEESYLEWPQGLSHSTGPPPIGMTTPAYSGYPRVRRGYPGAEDEEMIDIAVTGYGQFQAVGQANWHWRPIKTGAVIGSWTCPEHGILLGVAGVARFLGFQTFEVDNTKPWLYVPNGAWDYGNSELELNVGPGDWDPKSPLSNLTKVEAIPTGILFGGGPYYGVGPGEVNLCYIPESWVRVVRPRPSVYLGPSVTLPDERVGYQIYPTGSPYYITDSDPDYTPTITKPTTLSELNDRMLEVMGLYPNLAPLTDWIDQKLNEAMGQPTYDQKWNPVPLDAAGNNLNRFGHAIGRFQS